MAVWAHLALQIADLLDAQARSATKKREEAQAAAAEYSQLLGDHKALQVRAPMAAAAWSWDEQSGQQV